MQSLRSRLILSHVLPFLVIIPIMGVGLINLLKTQVLLTNLSSELTHQAVLVAAVAMDYNEMWYDPGRAQAFVSNVGPTLMAHVTLIDSTGHVLVTSDPQMAGQVGKVITIPQFTMEENGGIRLQVEYSRSHPDEISSVMVPVVHPYRGVMGYIRLSNPLVSIDDSFLRARSLTLWVLGGGLLAGILLGAIFATTLERPLVRTTQAVYQLARGEQTTPLAEQGPQEVRLLVRAFNTLSERLHALEVGRRQLLANLVHELGRPLGAMGSAVQALLGGADEDPGLRKELLEGMGDELARLRRLLDDLARLHDQVLGTLELNIQPVDLNEWLPRVLAPWREAAQEKHQTWDVKIAPDLPVLDIDPDRLAQAFGNLISNAIRYTQVGGAIQVMVTNKGSQVCFCVADNGPGISPDDQAKLFTPFYRGKSARRFSDGMGLGLYIARDLATAHGGELTVESSLGTGSQFCILVPPHHQQVVGKPVAVSA